MATQDNERKLQAKISTAGIFCSRDAEMIPRCLHRCHHHTLMPVKIFDFKSKHFFISVLSGINQHYAVQQREVLHPQRRDSRPETSKKSSIVCGFIRAYFKVHRVNVFIDLLRHFNKFIDSSHKKPTDLTKLPF